MGLIPAFDVRQWEEEMVDAEELLRGLFPGAGYVVYFIQAGDSYDGPVKIGLTGDLGSRLASLQLAHYEELYVRLVCHSVDTLDLAPARDLERHLHRAFSEAGHRIKGEWFRPEGEVLEFMTDPAACLETFAFFPWLDSKKSVELMRMGFRA